MRSAFVLFWVVTLCRAYTHHMLSRNLFTQLTVLQSLKHVKPPETFPHALVVSCGETGRAIVQAMKQKDFHVAVTTTKPSRVPQLQNMCDEVVTIPQIETKQDEELTRSILRSDLVVLADTIKIFSPHTYVRTANRVKAIIEKHQWPGMVCLVSSENAYGCPRRGEELKEKDNVIFANMVNRTQWKLNTNVVALQIRHAESVLLASTPKSVVFRTAGLWDEKKFYDTALYTSKKEFNAGVGESWMTFATTNMVANSVISAYNKQLTGIFNVANLPPMRRKDLLRGLHCIYGMENAKWTDRELDMDVLFSVDSQPFLPCSQRGNSRLRCDKLAKALSN